MSFRVGKSNFARKFKGAGLTLGWPQQSMGFVALGDLVSNPHHRIQRGHWFLEDHGDLPATRCSPFVGGLLQEIDALKQNFSVQRVDCVWEKAHQSLRANRFT